MRCPTWVTAAEIDDWGETTAANRPRTGRGNDHDAANRLLPGGAGRAQGWSHRDGGHAGRRTFLLVGVYRLASHNLALHARD
jgi:hypothetical protein